MEQTTGADVAQITGFGGYGQSAAAMPPKVVAKKERRSTMARCYTT